MELRRRAAPGSGPANSHLRPGRRYVGVARQSLARRAAKWRGGLWGELSLALPPTITVVAVIVLIEDLAHQRLLFASLASSAFLIYYDPLHRMNSVRVMASAQLLGCFFGIGFGLLLGPGYIAAAIAMASTIVACLLLDVIHPPAVSTSIAFAYVPVHERTVGLFLLALGLIVALVVLQRLSVWTLGRMHLRTPSDS